MTAWAGGHGTRAAQTQVQVALAVGFAPAAMPVLAALALWRPGWSAPVMTALVGGWVAASLATVVWATAWAQYEDTHGPLGLIVLLALCVPLVLLGRARALRAGVLLLVAVITPILCGIAAMLVTWTVGGGIVLVLIGTPFLVSAVLLVLASRSERKPSARPVSSPGSSLPTPRGGMGA